MQLLYFESVLAIKDDIVVSFVPTCDGCQLRPWKTSKRVQCQPVKGNPDEVHNKYDRNRLPRREVAYNRHSKLQNRDVEVAKLTGLLARELDGLETVGNR